MNLTKVSKFLSLILRHKPEAIGITLDEHGWAVVDDLIDGVAENYPGFNKEMLEEIVATDEKQRYSFDADRVLIRANQGHSVKVDVELEQLEPPEYLYHGSATKYVNDIYKAGLIPKSRLYVHLSSSIGTAANVGKRHGKPVVFRVKAKAMYDQGFIFYKSENGVWLTERVAKEHLEVIFAVDDLVGE